MPVAITASPSQIAAAPNQFSPTYHADFSRVRPFGQVYTNRHLSRPAVTALAQPLGNVLRSWGAGKRKAPAPRRVTEIENTLALAPVHNALGVLNGLPLSRLSVMHNQRSFIGTPTTQATLNTFDTHLFEALQALATGILCENTNATYPMKALLLITGLMPAFDSQVRCGLHRGGFSGMNRLSFCFPPCRHAPCPQIDSVTVRGNVCRCRRSGAVATSFSLGKVTIHLGMFMFTAMEADREMGLGSPPTNERESHSADSQSH